MLCLAKKFLFVRKSRDNSARRDKIGNLKHGFHPGGKITSVEKINSDARERPNIQATWQHNAATKPKVADILKGLAATTQCSKDSSTNRSGND